MNANQLNEEPKRIQLSVRMSVLVTVDAILKNGDVYVESVVSLTGSPSPEELMEALDAEGELGQLDNAFLAAGGTIN